MNSTPAPVIASPTGVKSNTPKLPSPASARSPETMRLGGVPIRVVVPPRMEPKASGISALPGGRFSRAEICRATGISSASAPTLFMKADRNAATAVSEKMASVGPALAGSTWRVSTSTAPEDCRPWLNISTQATVITAGCANPAKAPAYGTNPVNTQASSAPSATMSWRHRPQMNMAAVATRMPTMSNCSMLMTISCGGGTGPIRPQSSAHGHGAEALPPRLFVGGHTLETE